MTSATSVTSGPPPTLWQCTLGKMSESELTVGSPFGLTCEGPVVESFAAKNLSLELSKNDQFKLRILESNTTSGTKVELIVTSYVAGENRISDAVLTDGEHRVALSGIQFQVKSVIEKAETQPTPFPPADAEIMAWPIWVPIAIACALVFLFGTLFLMIRNRKRKEAFLKWLKENQSVLSPFDQLNKELRKVARERDPAAHLAELERATRWYLAKRLEQPLLQATPKEISRALLKRVRKKDFPAMTNQLMSEFKRLQESIAVHQSEDERRQALEKTLPAVSELVRDFSNQVEKAMNIKTSRSQRSTL